MRATAAPSEGDATTDSPGGQLPVAAAAAPDVAPPLPADAVAPEAPLSGATAPLSAPPSNSFAASTLRADTMGAEADALTAGPLFDRHEPQSKFRPVAGYSRFVDLMKVLLPGGAAVVFVSIILVTFLFNDDPQISVIPSVEPAKVQNELMETPELSGFDDKGRPYKITARTAQRDEAHEQLISLTDLHGWMLANMTQALDADTPVADQISNTQGDEITVTSTSGLLNTEKQTLALNGNVVMTDGKTYRIEAVAALVDMAQRQVSGDQGVHVAMDWGTVDADGFDAYDNQQKVIFKGHVKTVAY